MDANGSIYVSDQGTHQVKVFTPEGKPLRTIGKPGGPGLGAYDEQRMASPATGSATSPRRRAAGGRVLGAAEQDLAARRIVLHLSPADAEHGSVGRGPDVADEQPPRRAADERNLRRDAARLDAARAEGRARRPHRGRGRPDRSRHGRRAQRAVRRPVHHVVVDQAGGLRWLAGRRQLLLRRPVAARRHDRPGHSRRRAARPAADHDRIPERNRPPARIRPAADGLQRGVKRGLARFAPQKVPVPFFMDRVIPRLPPGDCGWPHGDGERILPCREARRAGGGDAGGRTVNGRGLP
ncbi:MAG: hypothetical protein ACKOHG_10990, partial [Planctomycetia bacterium]